MKKIFIDLEMHPIPRSFTAEREICTQEVIEIGAVKLNEENDPAIRKMIVQDLEKAEMFVNNQVVDTEYYILFKEKNQ